MSPINRNNLVPDAVSGETEPFEQNEVVATPEDPYVIALPTHMPFSHYELNSYAPVYIPPSDEAYMESQQFLPADDLSPIHHHTLPPLAPDHLFDLFNQTYPYIFHPREPIPEEDIPSSSRLRISEPTPPLSPSLPYPPGFTPPAHIHETGESAKVIPTPLPSTVVTRLERHEDQIDTLIQMIDFSSFDPSAPIDDTLHSLISNRTELQRGLTQLQSDVLETRSFAISLRREGQNSTWEAHLASRRANTLENLIGDIRAQHYTEMQSLRDQISELRRHVNGPSQ